MVVHENRAADDMPAEPPAIQEPAQTVVVVRSRDDLASFCTFMLGAMFGAVLVARLAAFE